jgi:hypothetical protein
MTSTPHILLISCTSNITLFYSSLYKIYQIHNISQNYLPSITLNVLFLNLFLSSTSSCPFFFSYSTKSGKNGFFTYIILSYLQTNLKIFLLDIISKENIFSKYSITIKFIIFQSIFFYNIIILSFSLFIKIAFSSALNKFVLLFHIFLDIYNSHRVHNNFLNYRNFHFLYKSF